ncbi:protein LBH-like [Boleophthalmus pectinirostris]|uniref:protein LBH-like n=1 Tax=Boleophthalmus pectinirostris TaxID=150288 RepID=UPI00242B38B5|nr:protein LBH-like [Boleophthalmus pectinirostris]
MSCIPASHSMTLMGQVEPPLEEASERRGSRAYQIFPEANDSDSDSYPEDFLYRRERLPSIVVEPTEQSEAESGELRWPPRTASSEGEEEDSQLSQSTTEGDTEDMDQGSSSRKSSIGPSQSQMSLSRLTPPASPTPPESAPPCLRS